MLKVTAIIGLLLGIFAGVSVSATTVLLLLVVCLAVIAGLAFVKGGGDTAFAAILISIFFSVPFLAALIITNLVTSAL